ncbi:MAG: ACP phosphodiesterase [Planctomycetota bacterium]
MNWLAHLRLAPAAPLVRLGNLAGDFVRGVDVAALHPELQRGVAQHRAVDRFVDAHEVHRRGRGRLLPRARRFAGVALDVFFDHFQARRWGVHGDGGSLARFVDGVHDDLDRHCALLPPELRRLRVGLRAQGWLHSYGTVEGVERVLEAMARRRPRAAPLAAAASELRRCYDEFGADFEELWPQLTQLTATHR